VNAELDRAVAPFGLFFPPNPGSWASATIGGNVATNASGPRSLRYGATRRWVRGVEGVLGTGERIRWGPTTPKQSAGPDLLALLVGSEGTLAVFTRIQLGLAVAPARRTGLVLPLPASPPLGAIARGFVEDRELPLSALEYIDRGSASELAREEGSRLPMDTGLLLAELESPDEERETRALERFLDRARELGLGDEVHAYPDADQLWTLRGESGAVLDRRLGPRLREDVGAPLDRLQELVGAIEQIARDHGVPLYLYGHLGEGNLHPNFVVDPRSDAARSIRSRLYEETFRLGGTVSAEHGIGSRKREYLEREVGAPAVGILRAVKAACDPDSILNPGKLLPDPGPGAAASP